MPVSYLYNLDLNSINNMITEINRNLSQEKTERDSESQTLSNKIDSLANSKVMLTPEGGVAVRYINKTGFESVKGEVVTVYNGGTSINNAVQKVVQDIPNAIGVFYESGITDGAEVWVVVSGIADVYFVGDTTHGQLARTFVSTDANYVIGQAVGEAIPTSPFATDKHFCEIGHVLESRTGPGLAKVNLHFN